MIVRSLFFALLLLPFASSAQTAVGTWDNFGPIQFPVNVSGQVNGMARICQIKFHPTDSLKMYAVSSSGGLYITKDGGATWAHTTGTDQLPATQCSSVCIDYTNDSILYLSTGDPDYYYEDYGIWKSKDGGNTWHPSNTGIGNAMAVEILMDPTNHNQLVAATDNGIWRTIDAGDNWTQTYTSGNFTDMKMKPWSKTTIYAVTRTNFLMSTDFGATWTEYTGSGMSVAATTSGDGLRLAVSTADSNIIYVGNSDGNGIIYKSVDGGSVFSTIYSSDTQCVVCYDAGPSSGSQHNYNFSLTANPENVNELILVSHCVWRSMDGGISWSKRTSWPTEMHTDMHDIKFNPYNNNQMICGNDGGVWMSTDTLATYWVPISNGIAAMELYHMGQSPSIRQLIDAGAQDNGENHFDGIWKCNGGGDMGSHIAFDYRDNATVYHINSGSRKQLIPLGGDQSLNQPFVVNGNPIIEFTPALENVAFYGQDTLYRTTDLDNTLPDWSLIGIMPGAISAMASCRADSNILYVVTNENQLYRSTNALSASPVFTSFTTPGSTGAATSIATDQSDANKVYLSCGQSVYVSNNKGSSWSNITGSLPPLNINKIIHDDKSASGRLFVCIGNYVYYKSNTDTGWIITHGLPSVSNITDFGIYNDGTAAGILRLSTYGRGTWEVSIHNDLPPAIAFAANKQVVCPADTVQFSKTVYGPLSSVKWRFPGGMPDSSTADSPAVMYLSAGTYPVTLFATNANGTDSLIKTSYILVDAGGDTSLQEGFEVAFPPVAWANVSPTGSYLWVQTSFAGGYGLSSKSVLFDNYDISANGAIAQLITPPVNLANTLSAYVTFDVAYARYPGYNDSLEVGISTDCGKTFTTVYAKDSTLLATAPDKTDTIFIPTATQWRTDTISLAAYLGSEVQVAFENVGHFGQALYVDNVNIHITPTPSQVSSIDRNEQVQVYPNPTNGMVTISAKGLQGKKVRIVCYAMSGSAVMHKDALLTNGALNMQINLKGLPPGAYLVQVFKDDGEVVVKPVILK